MKKMLQKDNSLENSVAMKFHKAESKRYRYAAHLSVLLTKECKEMLWICHLGIQGSMASMHV